MNKINLIVLMAVYNGEKYLKNTINSVLTQSYSDFEFLIINDNSTDNSVKIIKSYNDNRIRLISNNKNIGLTKSLNIGLREARGKYIARIDADDISLPNRLKKQYEYLENNPDISLIGSYAEIIDQNGKVTIIKKNPTEHNIINLKLLFANSFVHSSIFFKKDHILKLRGYNENYKYSQDFELYHRVAKKYKVANLPIPLIQHRVHKNRLSSKKKNKQKLCAINIIHKNINNYFKITFDEAKKIHESYYGYINNKKELNTIILLYKNILIEYLKQNNINPEYKTSIKEYFNKNILNRIKNVNLNKKNIFKKIYFSLQKTINNNLF